MTQTKQPKKITIEDVIAFSKPHRVGEGRHTRISNDTIEASIVGGARGLYGDFKNDFELAIFDKKTGEFVTKFFISDANDDVLGYLPADELLSILNNLFSKGFQVQ